MIAGEYYTEDWGVFEATRVLNFGKKKEGKPRLDVGRIAPDPSYATPSPARQKAETFTAWGGTFLKAAL